MKKILFFASAVLFLLKFSAMADTISGIVTDSATGKPLAYARVYTDSAHKVYTDSLGNFSFNTDGTVGIVESECPRDETCFLGAEFGDVFFSGKFGSVEHSNQKHARRYRGKILLS